MKLLAILLVIAGCSFSPDIGDGTIHCGPNGSCPEGFMCGAENLCYRTQTLAIDARMPDAPPPPPDASPDACKHHCDNGPDCCH